MTGAITTTVPATRATSFSATVGHAWCRQATIKTSRPKGTNSRNCERAIAVNPDGTLAWPSGLIPGLTTHPAKVGDVIIIYATGLGAVDSPPDNGQGSLDKLRQTITKPTVMVGGITANVLFAGLSPQFVGVNQLNVIIPNTAAGSNVPLQIQVGGITSPDSVTIAVSN